MPASYAIKDYNESERSFRVLASTSKPLKRQEWDEKTKAFVEFFEALEGWDFSRYEKNPLVLESHNSYDINAAIGQGSELKQTADGGLEMKITLAPANANARTLELEQKIKTGLVRGVSVGWDYGDRTDEQRGGRIVRVYRNNRLSEVSLCLIPADEDALVEAETDPAARETERASNAARVLASRRVTRSDASDEDVQRFDFVSGLGKLSRTQVGGLRVPARIARIGVLEYRLGDGSVRRELRLPEEVFAADSIETLRGAPVTDLAHHRGLIDIRSWKDATLGHVESIRQDGNYLSADLIVNDANAIVDLENGRLHDISCGYVCRLDFTPGVWNGEPYDAVQRKIRCNHVAILPRGKGRSGTDVSVRLDSKDAECVEIADPEQETNMADPITTKTLIKLDGRDLEYGSKEHIDALEDAHLKDLEKAETEKKDLVTRCDKAEAGQKVAEKKALDLEEEKKGEAERAKTARKKRFKLLRSAARFLYGDEDEDEEKTDALDDKTDREIMVEVLRADARWKDDKFEGSDGKPRSDEYVEAIFDSVTKDFKRADGVDSVVRSHDTQVRTDARNGGESPVEKARKERAERNANRWNKPAA